MHHTAHSSNARTIHTLRQLLPATRHGARLARTLTAGVLAAWDAPPEVTERAAHIAAELSANAVLHGRMHGRDFRLCLALNPDTEVLRVAVTDARGDQYPSCSEVADSDEETGRGMLLVAVLADRWGAEPCAPGGKTVWAELALDSPPI